MDAPSPKIIDKLNENIANGKKWFSFEYFPPKTEAGVQNLYDRIDRMASLNPTFIDVTWGAGGTTAGLTMELSTNAQQYSGVDVMMHLTCTNMKKEMVDDALAKAKAGGIHNILALRGDPPKGEERWTAVEGGFANAVDLVRYIRQEYGDYFCIGVAGYPEGHLEAESYEKDVQYLKEKLDAGAEFVITQLFYSTEVFLKWVQDCRNVGITAPIIPGIMPINAYGSFTRMTGFCKTLVPPEIKEILEPVKDDDEKVKAAGVDIVVKICKDLLAAGIPALHFYTLNLEKSVSAILKKLGFVKDDESTRKLPWRPSTMSSRRTEDVRPIFWANRPKSYLQRTRTWDEFPNGRWGDARSPAFGDLSHDYYLGRLAQNNDQKEKWGEPKSDNDVWEVFAQFAEGKLDSLPWCEGSLSAESIPLVERLAGLNRKGILTINSQPAVNAMPSSDPVVGWGGSGGYVYQKAYIEFFTSPSNMDTLLKLFEAHPNLTYHAVNMKGESKSNNIGHVNAVTWGVFPGKEVLQPTIVDPNVFENVWAEEAFSLWTSVWGHVYPKDSESMKVLEQVQSTYWLVNIVDNDFINGDLFTIFESI